MAQLTLRSTIASNISSARWQCVATDAKWKPVGLFSWWSSDAAIARWKDDASAQAAGADIAVCLIAIVIGLVRASLPRTPGINAVPHAVHWCMLRVRVCGRTADQARARPMPCLRRPLSASRALSHSQQNWAVRRLTVAAWQLPPLSRACGAKSYSRARPNQPLLTRTDQQYSTSRLERAQINDTVDHISIAQSAVWAGRQAGEHLKVV